MLYQLSYFRIILRSVVIISTSPASDKCLRDRLILVFLAFRRFDDFLGYFGGDLLVV
jgi:hypothetical protein